MTKMAARQQQVSVEGIPGLWATKSGGTVSADITPVWDGGANAPEQMAGPASADNITLSRPCDDARDIAVAKMLRPQVGTFRGTITVQPTDGRLFPIGEPTVYPDALLQSMSEPDYDAASSDPQVLETIWAISEYV
jgi:hypothetical protein